MVTRGLISRVIVRVGVMSRRPVRRGLVSRSYGVLSQPLTRVFIAQYEPSGYRGGSGPWHHNRAVFTIESIAGAAPSAGGCPASAVLPGGYSL